jgi:hypothetical protein
MAGKKTPAAKPEEPKQEVAVVDDRKILPSVRVVDDVTEIAELQGVEGAGLSDNVEDRGVPLFYIAQKGSPQLDKKQDKYIQGLEFGDVFNNLTGESYAAEAEGVLLLPCYFRANWNKWTPRDLGGGFHGSEPRDTPLLKGARQWVDKNGKTRRDILDLPDGDQLVMTHHYFCVVAETWTPVIVPMSSTQLGASRKLQAIIDSFKIQVNGRILVQPAYWNLWRFKTVYKDDGDNQWYLWAPEVEGQNEDPKLRAFCKEFALACKNNEVKMSNPVVEENGTIIDATVPI